jgi:hypothetical protein
MMQDRTAERMAYVLECQRNATGPTYEPDALKPAQLFKPQPRADLGPKQLQWLRDKVPSFAICEKLATESEIHRKKLLEAVRS